MALYGRHMIKVDETEVTPGNVVAILNKALPWHMKNRLDINYLWWYYRGFQPILSRVKEVRPEINNRVVENLANQIVSFKSGYLMGEPLQYVLKGQGENLTDAINKLNEYSLAEGKPAKDKKLADWFHICGTAYRMVLPDVDGDMDDCPFEIYTLDPRNVFVVYNNGLGNKPILGVKYVVNEQGVTTYSCYSKDEYYEIVDNRITKRQRHILGGIPIIEYPLNIARIGAFELVIGLLDAINLTQSNQIDGVEQFIQALMLFHNVDISSEDFGKLREQGAIKFRDIDPQMRAEVDYLVSSLNQNETQTLVDSMNNTVLTICGMPNRQMSASSTSDNVGSVIMRDGWSDAEARAKDAELMFKESEQEFLKIVLNICKTLTGMDLKVHNIEVRFTRRNYENITQKAQVLNLLLKNPKVHPQLAFAHSGLFADSELAYKMSMEYYEEEQRKLQEQENKEGGPDDSGTDSRDDTGDRSNSETREQG